MTVYFDNAATTPMDPRVVDAMIPCMRETFGNPSSIHRFGREARAIIEKSRKKVAELLDTSPAQIFFTSGGTEADNNAIISTIRARGIRKALTSPLEHHAVLHALEHLAHAGEIDLTLLPTDEKGNLDMDQLDAFLRENPGAFVSLMHGNNEIGNLNPVEEIALRVRETGGIFHSDTVQTVGHYRHNLNEWKTHFMVGSAHKFHGPKGIGFLYVSADVKTGPYIHGGAQERNMRGGTENLYGIVGLATALEISLQDRDQHQKHIEALKFRLRDRLIQDIPGVRFNGRSDEEGRSLYTVLNVSLPENEMNEMLLFNLDIRKIAASGGSACSSGSEVGSHVLRAIGAPAGRGAVRFSFSKYNTAEEVDYVAGELAAMYSPRMVRV